MPDPLPPRQVSTRVEAPATRELSALVETGLITPETQRALAVATDNLHLLKNVATPVGQRHFNRIDTIMSVRGGGSVISRARECLAGIGATWDGVRSDFHKFRELYYDAKLRRAKLAKMKKAIGECADELDAAIMQADFELESVRVDKIEAEVAHGEATLKGALAKATSHSAQYALILKESGKETFTEADFAGEEVEYFLKSAFWHACQTFTTADQRNARRRRAEDHAAEPGKFLSSRQEFENAHRAREHRTVGMSDEVFLYFESLGVDRAAIKAEVKRLLDQREQFELMNEGRDQSFEPQFEQWLTNMTSKYKELAVANAAKHGMDRLKRVAGLITPTDGDRGGAGDVGDMQRRSVIR